MDFTQVPEYGIILIIVASLTQNIKQTKINNNYLPWVSMVIGAVAGLVAAYMMKDTNYAESVITGIVIGGTSSGLFDGVKGLSNVIKKAPTSGGETSEEK